MSRADVEQRVAQIKHEAAVFGAAALEESAKLVAKAEAVVARTDKRILIAGAAVLTAAVAGAVLYKALKD